MKKIILIFSLLLLSISAVKAQTDEANAKRVDSLLTVYSNKKMFSGSILIAKDGKALLSKGYGMANYSYDIPNTAQTKFKLASVSKQFTAAAIIILQEQGKLSTDDKLTKYIPDYPNGDKITIHHLLTHTSGIVNFTSLPLFDSIMTFEHSLTESIAYFKNKPLEFEPGEKFNYSNSGYILLSYIIEKASGKKYHEFISNSIFEPLGMKNSGVFNGNTLIKNLAMGYSEIEGGVENVPYVDMSIPSGAGALYSTVEDLLIWDQALNSEKLLKKASIDKMFTPFKDTYAYGWMVDKYKEHKWIFHTGGIQGFATVVNRFPDDGLTIIILKNIDNQNMFNPNRVARAVMFNQVYELPVERKVVKVDEKIYKKLCGDYELMPGFVLSITTENGKLYSQATGQDKAEIFPEADYKYFLKVVNAQLEFTADKKGNVDTLTLLQGGQKMPGTKKKQ